MPSLQDASPGLVLAVVLVAGVASGALARRLHLPAVTGQILVGVLLGPSFGLLDLHKVASFEGVTQFALGLMAVAVGNHLHWKRLRNARRRLLLLVLLEVTVTPGLVYAAVVLVPSTSWTLALLVATIAVSTAPATILAVVKEARAKGVFVKTLVAAVALNNIGCILLFEMAHTAVRVSLEAEATASWLRVLAAPLVTLLASAALGGGVGAVLVLATRRVVRGDRLTTLSIIAILLTAGLADWIGVSTLLSCLFLGMALGNFTPDKEEVGHRVFENFESAIFAAFFTLAGMKLDLGQILPGGILALLAFGVRAAGKISAATLAMRLAGTTERVRRHLGLALLPQAGLAVGLMLLVSEDPALAPMQGLRDLFVAVVLASVALNEVLGPIATRVALRRSGDWGKDRPRLIDFIHEEHIVTDLASVTKAEAVERLCDLLLRTHHLKVDRDRFLASVQAHEEEASSSIGGGLAIPHGDLEEGEEILGVMGISPEGLDIPAPDGRPVHCIVLLATPLAARARHLEVLAALARALGADPALQQQLFHAKSPAHAYELLHADEESEDYNYFLEEM